MRCRGTVAVFLAGAVMASSCGSQSALDAGAGSDPPAPLPGEAPPGMSEDPAWGVTIPNGASGEGDSDAGEDTVTVAGLRDSFAVADATQETLTFYSAATGERLAVHDIENTAGDITVRSGEHEGERVAVLEFDKLIPAEGLKPKRTFMKNRVYGGDGELLFSGPENAEYKNGWFLETDVPVTYTVSDTDGNPKLTIDDTGDWSSLSVAGFSAEHAVIAFFEGHEKNFAVFTPDESDDPAWTGLESLGGSEHAFNSAYASLHGRTVYVSYVRNDAYGNPDDTMVAAHEARTGRVLWTNDEIGAHLLVRLRVPERDLLIGTVTLGGRSAIDDVRIAVAVDSETGDIVWKQDESEKPFTPEIVFNDVLYGTTDAGDTDVALDVAGKDLAGQDYFARPIAVSGNGHAWVRHGDENWIFPAE